MRLVERLNEALQRAPGVSLISAPAGFGKTTLVSEWVAGSKRQAAWLSLDEEDSDLARFLTYLVAALRTLDLPGGYRDGVSGVEGVTPGIGEAVLSALHDSQSQLPPIEPLMTALLNEITAPQREPATPKRGGADSGQGLILVLDDYHLIDAKAVDEALTYLVEHLPPNMHLVITTREDPALPLSRLRARGQLTELRAAELRFTPTEAAEFLNQIMDLNLSAEEVAALETRTEGWIAGLQLAALSMRGQQDVHGFIQSFAGDHSYIVDYLVEEVLQRQPEPVRIFLLQTSILNRLNGPLCDAVMERQGGQARLESLQRGNFFLIPLDDRRHWYRYHHLFADVLRIHLRAEQPDQIPSLHRRASEWYEQNGLAADAICHAFAAKDFERVADLIERVVPVMSQNRQEPTLLGWLKALPDEVLRKRPVLSAHYAGTLLQNGLLDGVEVRLRDAERWLDMPADMPERPIFVDEKDFKRLPATVAMYHAGIALVHGDVENTMKHARRVLELALEDDDFLRGAASALLGLASWTGGDLEMAHRMYANGMAYLQKVGFISDVIGGSIVLADIRLAQGRLRQAMSTYERGLQLATKQVPALRGAADMHVGLSEIYRERNDLNAAARHLLKSKELGELNGLRKNPYRWRVAMARIREARGDPDGALDLFEEAERLYEGDFSPNVRPVPALKARAWIAQGSLGEALGWVREQALSAGDDLSYLREFEHITLARVLLALHKRERSGDSLHVAIGLLERLLKAAEEGGRMGSAIEILVLLALAHQATGDIPSALAPLERALALAEPEGYIRSFLDEGSNMTKLLREAATCGILPGYTGRLLAEIEAEQQRDSGEALLPSSLVPKPLIEPLSQRELEILRLFRTELSGPEIARELVVALSTIRTHTKSIYSKLNVNSRRGAVKRAEELHLI